MILAHRRSAAAPAAPQEPPAPEPEVDEAPGEAEAPAGGEGDAERVARQDRSRNRPHGR